MMTTSPDIYKYCLSDIKYLSSHNKTNDDRFEGLIFSSWGDNEKINKLQMFDKTLPLERWEGSFLICCLSCGRVLVI